MNVPKELLYTKSHEWVKKLDDGSVLVGLSDKAQSDLGDLVFVNLPEVGDTLTCPQLGIALPLKTRCVMWNPSRLFPMFMRQ